MRDSGVNPRKVKPDTNEIKIGRNKSEDQINTIRNVITFLNLPQKNIELFRYYSFLLSEAKFKANMGKDSKY